MVVGLCRRTRDFTDRERGLLELLDPHIAHAYRDAEEREKIRAELDLLRCALEELDRGVVEVLDDGAIREATPEARRLLDAYFSDDPRRRHMLPERIRSWLDEQTALANIRPPPPPAPLVIGRGEDCLIVRGLTGDGSRLLLLKERRAHLAAESLSHLGISGREAEVLAWAAAGKSDEGIARILGMSFRTVKKHLEHVYQKLGVENRTAAAAIAHEAAGRAPSTRAGGGRIIGQ